MHSLVYICGARQTQIGSVLFKEIRRAVQNCPFWKAGLLPMTISPGIKSSPATVGEIQCRFIISGKNDEPTPDYYHSQYPLRAQADGAGTITFCSNF